MRVKYQCKMLTVGIIAYPGVEYNFYVAIRDFIQRDAHIFQDEQRVLFACTRGHLRIIAGVSKTIICQALSARALEQNDGAAGKQDCAFA